MKFQAKTKDCMLTVRAWAWFTEEFDERVLDVFSHMHLRGFLKPRYIRRGLVEYTGPVGVSLYERLQKPISKRDFFMIMEQALVAEQKLVHGRMSVNYMVLDPHHVYINEVTREVQFLYVPTLAPGEPADMIGFLKSVLYMCKPMERDTEYLTEFVYFLNSLRMYKPELIERYIFKADPDAIRMIRKQHAGSGFITSKPMHYMEHYENKQDDLPTDVVSDPYDGDLPTGLMDEEDYGGDLPTGLMDEEDFGGDLPTGLMDDGDFGGDLPTGLMDDGDFGGDLPTGLMNEADFAGDLPTGLMNEEDFIDDFPTGLMNEENYGMAGAGEDDLPTGLLLDDEAEWSRSAPVVHCPFLIRLETEEQIDITRPVFRLGRGTSNVSHTITNNNKIGRIHAELTLRSGRCFVTDLESKNGTFINDERLAEGVETEIRDGDVLMLANEKFIFHQ